MSERPRLIVVDDEPAIAAQLTRLGGALGFEVRTLKRARGFARALHRFRPSAVVIDLALPDDAGIWLLRRLAREKSPARVVVISGLDARLREAAARLARAYGLDVGGALGKPIDEAALAAALGAPLKRRRRRA